MFIISDLDDTNGPDIPDPQLVLLVHGIVEEPPVSCATVSCPCSWWVDILSLEPLYPQRISPTMLTSLIMIYTAWALLQGATQTMVWWKVTIWDERWHQWPGCDKLKSVNFPCNCSVSPCLVMQSCSHLQAHINGFIQKESYGKAHLRQYTSIHDTKQEGWMFKKAP